MEDFLDTEDLYFSKFARFLVAKFSLIKRIHIIFERAEVGDSFSNEMYIPTHPKNKIYIEPERVYADTGIRTILFKVDVRSIFHCKIRVWTSSLSWSGVNNDSKNAFTIDVFEIAGRTPFTYEIPESFDSHIIQV